MFNACFIAAGGIEWGSSRMRAHWVAPYMENAKVVLYDELYRKETLPPAQVYIFQKNCNTGAAEHLNRNGVPFWWDLCDPAWWWQPKWCRKIAKLASGIVCSSEALAADFKQWSGIDAHTVPDRLKLSHFNQQRQHQKVNPVRFIWFGISTNRVSLYGAFCNLERLQANGHHITLTIMDESPRQPLGGVDYSFPVAFTKWNLEKEVETLARHDIALLSPFPGPWGKVKSNNKMLTASACGLPTVDGMDYEKMRQLVDSHNNRRRALMPIGAGESSVYHVKRSAEQWAELLNV